MYSWSGHVLLPMWFMPLSNMVKVLNNEVGVCTGNIYQTAFSLLFLSLYGIKEGSLTLRSLTQEVAAILKPEIVESL